MNSPILKNNSNNIKSPISELPKPDFSIIEQKENSFHAKNSYKKKKNYVPDSPEKKNSSYYTPNKVSNINLKSNSKVSQKLFFGTEDNIYTRVSEFNPLDENVTSKRLFFNEHNFDKNKFNQNINNNQNSFNNNSTHSSSQLRDAINNTSLFQPEIEKLLKNNEDFTPIKLENRMTGNFNRDENFISPINAINNQNVFESPKRINLHTDYKENNKKNSFNSFRKYNNLNNCNKVIYIADKYNKEIVCSPLIPKDVKAQNFNSKSEIKLNYQNPINQEESFFKSKKEIEYCKQLFRSNEENIIEEKQIELQQNFSFDPMNNMKKENYEINDLRISFNNMTKLDLNRNLNFNDNESYTSNKVMQNNILNDSYKFTNRGNINNNNNNINFTFNKITSDFSNGNGNGNKIGNKELELNPQKKFSFNSNFNFIDFNNKGQNSMIFTSMNGNKNLNFNDDKYNVSQFNSSNNKMGYNKKFNNVNINDIQFENSEDIILSKNLSFQNFENIKQNSNSSDNDMFGFVNKIGSNQNNSTYDSRETNIADLNYFESNFKIIKMLDEGCFGLVYLCQNNSNELFAIKISKKNYNQ